MSDTFEESEMNDKITELKDQQQFLEFLAKMKYEKPVIIESEKRWRLYALEMQSTKGECDEEKPDVTKPAEVQGNWKAWKE